MIVPVNTAVTVTTAATRVQAHTTATTAVSTVYFEALGTNTGYIYVGMSDVSSTVYIARLSAGQGISFSSDSSGSVRMAGVDIQLSSFYVDSSVSGEKVQMTYLQRMTK